jgi:Ig-like domain from next to BRCA1 gene
MIPKRFPWAIAIAGMAVLTACNIGKAPEPTPDVNALYTVAAQTLIAQSGLDQTQTAAANSPTPLVSPTPLASFTPLPTFPVLAGLTPFGSPIPGLTPLAGITPLATQGGVTTAGMAVGCNNAVYMGQSLKDGTVMSSQEEFKVGFSLQNTGTCDWGTSYSFAFKSGDQMSGEDVRIVTADQVTKPGHSQAFVLHLQAPKAKGEYTGYWQMKDGTGQWFGSLVYIKIVVG